LTGKSISTNLKNVPIGIDADKVQSFIYNHPEIILLHVCSEEELDKFSGSIKIFFKNISLESQIFSLSKTESYFVYSNNLENSLFFSNLLVSNNFSNVYFLDGEVNLK
jgi:hypothetical protein